MDGAEAYMHEQKWNGPICIDVVSVKTSTPPQIEHFEDAFH
jgi:Holliday junction resolvase-like predicted endonuclease